MGSLLMPLEIALPLFATRWTSGPLPFKLALLVYPFKVVIVPLTALLVYGTPPMDPFPWAYWVAMLAVAIMSSICTEWMFVSQIALFAKVSDPAIGGTYMSFLNTVANLGQKLPPTATFFLVDHLTCLEDGCYPKMNGFYLMTTVCTLIGVVWYTVAKEPLHRMQLLDIDEWRAGSKKKRSE
jgi:PAT family acetyl-CoA transporter-like MFS transporter 1